ncbi:MurR/RpiR family transcriptional regulator [Schleiferilactobacillus perolens]|jgi:DNA-binding MurR/RpiR family transcriptional regulator|uniref:MurR/RpiR family transcriptional regulator n=1 Tax=Schleiferilactobacillus perolens TaxID=100468 RepID=UPI0023561C20|nr:MurR/RpiR family transcriptional regulator [Schleiferilactobacillus perolens]MCI2170461.1 MurR/RpiR family transcriptional regulator [Schleiferilactobacillus perolens]
MEEKMLFLDSTPQLGPLDLEILGYVTNHLALIPYLPIRTLASKTHTSTASILRFCKKFGCSGYGEFKVRLKLYLERENVKSEIDNHIDEYSEFLSSTRNTSTTDVVNKVVQILRTKEIVLFLGAGTSETIAQYGSLYFANLSIPALKISDPSNYPANMFSADFLGKACFVVMSISGETKEIIEYLGHIRESRTTIVSICNSDASTIARMADINIPYNITRETVQKNLRDPEKETEITSQLPALFLLEKIAREYNKN